MVADCDLVNRLREIVSTSDLNTTTSGAVRRQLEQHFGVSFSHRKKFISQQIDLVLQEGQQAQEQEQQEQQEQQQEEEAVEEASVEEAEPEAAADDEKDIVDENKSQKRRANGFTKLCNLSPQLQHLLGVSQLARTQVVKQLWAYIKEKDLQDPLNRRNIKCDPNLHSIFRVDTINMFKMNQVLSKHIWPLEPHEESSSNSPPVEKKHKHKKEENLEPKPKKRKEKKE